MSDLIKIDTAQVVQIADKMASLNDELQQTLESAKKTITNLNLVWEGEAANSTIDAINEFSAKYFQSYYNLIDNYVAFLRKTVSEGYEQAETANTSLSEAFK